MRYSPFAILASLALVPVLVQAAPHSYNTIDIDYVDAELDPFDGNGWSIRGSGNIADHIYLFGQYSDVGTDRSGLDLDVERLSLGGGYQVSPNIENLNVFGQISFEDVQADSDVPRFDADGSGFGLEAGVRYAVMPRLEVTVSGRYLDVDEYFDGELGGTVGVVYDVLPWLGLSLDYDYNNIDISGDRGEDERILAGVRLYWDQLPIPGRE